ncbi:MAG: rRNA maturation RNase YbeY [Flavobacteriales bacterium]|jgi:probable rRNA maturation factor|nr:rRNA maturation RNase YbeY [Flavobacteriales bacterium]MBT6965006.1 rRNA maturation RNase YbeY [Flavobacteriales bacterium]
MIAFEYLETEEITEINQNKKWLNQVISNEAKEEGDITYIFCDDDYLLEKNIRFLNHNTLTDVITFDYCEGNSVSGDIFISIERVKENSEVFKVDFLTELNRVMVHGLLHLLGYKDKTERESNLMRKKENYYLSKY